MGCLQVVILGVMWLQLTWNPCSPVYIYNHTQSLIQRNIVRHIERLKRELVADALVRYETVQHIKDFYHKSLAYQMSTIGITITSKFRRMLQIHNATKYNMSMQYTGWIGGERYLEMYINYTVELQHLRQEIEYYIQMFEQLEKNHVFVPDSPIGVDIHERIQRLRRFGGYERPVGRSRRWPRKDESHYRDIPTLRRPRNTRRPLWKPGE